MIERRGVRRAASSLIAAGAALALVGCWGWSAPVDEPGTPEPVSVTPTALDPEVLEHHAEQCGEVPDADAAFVAEVSRPDSALPAGMTIEVGLRVVLEAEHGKHSVDVTYARGAVLDGEGRVVGLVVALSAPGSGGGSGTAVSMPVWLTVGACAGDGAALGDPLADGEYTLVLSGPITPVDHDHAVGETWMTNPLPFEVANGEIAS